VTAKTEVLGAIIEVWSRSQDIDGVLRYMTEDVVWHYSAVTMAPTHGKVGAREFLEAYKARVRNPTWRIFKTAESENTLFVEGVDEFDTPDGVRVVIPYAGVLEFEDGKVSAWRDYFDRGVLDRGTRGEELPDFAQQLADRPALPGLGG